MMKHINFVEIRRKERVSIVVRVKVVRELGEMKKKILTGAGIVVLVLGIVYGAGVFYYKDRFFQGTEINGLVCENLTAKDAEKKLKEKVENYTLEILWKEKEKGLIQGEEIGYTYVSDDKAAKLLSEQNPFLWLSGFFRKNQYQAAETARFDEKKLKERLESFPCMKEENMTQPKDAYIAFEGNQFVIKEEIQGTVIDKDAFFEKVKETVSQSGTEISAEEAGVYKAPSITRENADLKRQQEIWNSCAAVTVKYIFGNKTEVLDGMTVKDWLTYDEAGNYVENPAVLQQRVREYVQILGEKYNTVGKPRIITSTYTGQPVSVEGGSYGFLIDEKGEREQLLADIQGHVNTQREPVYARRGAAYGENDLGNTYVELDLSAQHLWYYKDGALLMESDFVSGTYYNYERRTPGGTYFLNYKQRNQVLRPAPNPDGSYDYESPVSYWLPFNGGIGLHDANWRWNFGGSIYLYSGSHGCINLPVSFAGGFYENIEPGCPIVCFYR